MVARPFGVGGWEAFLSDDIIKCYCIIIDGLPTVASSTKVMKVPTGNLTICPPHITDSVRQVRWVCGRPGRIQSDLTDPAASDTVGCEFMLAAAMYNF